MENLLQIDFVIHYGLPESAIPIEVEKTQATYFEIEDTDNKALKLHFSTHTGMARIANPKELMVTILNYDQFMSSLPPHFQNDKKRCDLILYCDSYFVLGELKDRLISSTSQQKNVRKKAKKQLQASLTTLMDVPNIAALALAQKVRRCCYFNKQATSPSLLTATRAFNRLPALFQNGFQMNAPTIEQYQFEYWEYLGTQTLKLT